jgi:diguanylate cyclase (GGDEF)-like protein
LTLRFLVVESDPVTAGQLLQTLSSHFGRDCALICPSCHDTRQADLDRVDLILSEVTLTDGSALDLLSEVLLRRPDLPFVLLANVADAQLGLRAIRQGAYDYLLKTGDYLAALPVILQKNLAIWQTKQDNLRLQNQLTKAFEQVRLKNQQLEEAVTKLRTMASTDPLTGLSNRRDLSTVLDRIFAESDRYHHDLAAIMIDLDRFKQLNDAAGHPVGDHLLQIMGRVLSTCCRRCDIACRYGGDEFLLILPESGIDRAQGVARRLSHEFAQATAGFYDQLENVSPVTLSVGIASLYQSHPPRAEALIAHADYALYRAKQQGRARAVIFTPPTPVAQHAPLAV